MQKARGCRKLMLQSAMEYLMTYGWAILIVAVVLGALFQLGVFSGSSLAPRAQPGACKVFRPNGPGTTTFINLAGVCTGQLPQFVAQFGASSYTYVSVPNSRVFFSNPNAVTVSVWVNLKSAFSDKYRDIQGFTACCGASGYDMLIEPSNGGAVAFEVVNVIGNRFYENPGIATPLNVWINYLGVYDGGAGTVTLYINGVQRGQLTGVPAAVIGSRASPMNIGGDSGGDAGSFPGYLVNLQIYNASLSASEIQGLYVGGIGGAPTRLQNLVGWWPLNGNVNDYSGNSNNGAVSNVIFTSSWTR